MFDYDNLQIMCWRCNRDKDDDNTFELQHTCEYLDTLAEEALARYQLLWIPLQLLLKHSYAEFAYTPRQSERPTTAHARH